MRSLLIFFLLLAPLPAILIKPHLGVLIWAWVSYMNPHRLTYGPAFDFSFLDIIAPVTLVGLFFSSERRAVPNHPITWLIVIFAIFCTITTFTSLYPEMAWDKWEQFMKTLLFTFITVILISTPRRLHALLLVIVVSLGYFAVKGGIFTLFQGGTSIVWGPQGSFIEDNNALALALVMYVPILTYFFTRYKERWIRWSIGIAIVVSLLAILGSQSRGALLAVITMVTFLTLKSRHRMVGLAAIAVVSVGALVFMPAKWQDRMETIGDFRDDPSAMGRITMWRFATQVARDHPLGGGFSVFYSPQERSMLLPADARGYNAHSIYFETLGEHGYFGLFLYLLLGATAYFTASGTIQICRKASPGHWAEDLSRMLQVSLVGFAVAGGFLNLGTFDLYYHILALILITRKIAERELELPDLKKVPVRLPLAKTKLA